VAFRGSKFPRFIFDLIPKPDLSNRPRLEGVALACPAKRGEPRIRRPRWGLCACSRAFGWDRLHLRPCYSISTRTQHDLLLAVSGNMRQNHQVFHTLFLLPIRAFPGGRAYPNKRHAGTA
jgi:hypothetical protein